MLSGNVVSYFLVQIAMEMFASRCFHHNANENVFLVFAWKAHTKRPLLLLTLALFLFVLMLIK